MTGLTGLVWQLLFYPPMGQTVKFLFHLSLHRRPLILLSPLATPLAIWRFHQGKGDPFVGFGPHHRPDRVPKPVHLHLLQNRALKVLYGLFLFDLLF